MGGLGGGLGQGALGGELAVLGPNTHRVRLAPVVFALALGGALGGCSGSFSELIGKQSESLPSDPKLFPATYKTEVAAFMRTYLGNPTRVKDAFIGEPVLKPVAGVEQYVTCVRYNPRDSKNQYQGNQTNLAIFVGGHLTQFLPGDAAICAGLAYQRYPDVESMVP